MSDFGYRTLVLHREAQRQKVWSADFALSDSWSSYIYGARKFQPSPHDRVRLRDGRWGTVLRYAADVFEYWVDLDGPTRSYTCERVRAEDIDVALEGDRFGRLCPRPRRPVPVSQKERMAQVLRERVERQREIDEKAMQEVRQMRPARHSP